MAKVSVIIPVYNSAIYLNECIESLLQQTLSECEFIFVNDGSRDNSKQIIESYQAIDKRIILLNQENQGVSVARNNGMNVATGEYIGFVDADDYVKKDMFAKLYRQAKYCDCDSVLSDFESKIEGRTVITTYPFQQEKCLDASVIKKEILPYLLQYEDLNQVWNKLYKRNVIEEYKICFPVGIDLGEDGMFNLRFFSKAKSLIYVQKSYYYYREVQGSATRNISQKDYFKNALEVYLHNHDNVIVGEDKRVEELKANKLIRSVISYTHIYFTPTKDMSFLRRYSYVSKMINNEEVIKALVIYKRHESKQSSKYEQLLLQMIRKKLVLGLYVLTAYSRYRNK
ncbi:glycosyltransferase [Ectobacillus sp. JY-23]|uniref:glycosyltransferase family 2 protein n=1 Tax=Ectobacillus sp. JY-23 TaxID=2933872 RepID=UPI001FF26EB0|nr:glycosyltransferase [Ectobacillus sp. JY-23]UOY92700.1 glycosyltransferase [Ectobacillus sp. JY-23]